MGGKKIAAVLTAAMTMGLVGATQAVGQLTPSTS